MRAGVLPQVRQGRWGTHTVTIVPGKRPIAALASALAHPGPGKGQGRSRAGRGSAGPGSRAAPAQSPGQHAALPAAFIDQLEELLTLSETAGRFGEVLSALLAYAPISA